MGMREVVERLKTGAYGFSNWRQKNKDIESLKELLVKLNPPESLIDALPAALKNRADKRGEFASKTVQFAEGEIREHIAALEAKISNFENEVSEQAQVIFAA